MKDSENGRKLRKLIEGFVALCMGSSDCLVWLDQDDASAFSDANHVFLPRPQGIDGEQDLLLGIAMREVARCTHCDASVFANGASEAAGYSSAIEDARIKSVISESYKGAPALFDAATAVIHRVATQAVVSAPDNVELVKQFAVWFAANDAYLGTPAANLAATEFASLAESQLQPATVQRALGLAQASPLLSSTKASLDCGVRIHALLKPPVPQQEPEPEQSSGEGDCEESKNGDNPTAESTGGGDSNGDRDGQPSDTGDSPNSSAEAGGEGHTGHSQDVMSNALARLKGHAGAMDVAAPEHIQPASQDPVDGELLKSLQEALASPSALEKIDEILASMPTEPSDDESADDATDLASLLGASSGGAKVTYLPGANSLDGLPARLVNVLLRALHDKRPTKMLRRESGHDIDCANVWKLRRLGETRVFRKKSPSAGVDAAVHVLLDISGSMKDGIELAASCTNAFAIALQRISGVQTAINVFPSANGSTDSILKYRENPAKARAKLSAIQAHGGTPTAEAIQDVLPVLMRVQVQKRAIVLITDGKPDKRAETVNAIAHANRLGVDVIGIGIGVLARIEEILPGRSIAIKSVAELPRGLEDLFKGKLSTSMLAA